MALSAEDRSILEQVTTATLTTILLKKGLRNVWIRGAMPLRADQPRIVGEAFTLRFVPAREDLATPASWGSPISTRAAIEDMPEGCICVIDAMGLTDAGVFGDILCARMAKRKVAAMVTDGVVRDLSGVLATGLPVWCRGAAAPPSVAGLTFVGWNETIGCGGVAVISAISLSSTATARWLSPRPCCPKSWPKPPPRNSLRAGSSTRLIAANACRGFTR